MSENQRFKDSFKVMYMEAQRLLSYIQLDDIEDRDEVLSHIEIALQKAEQRGFDRAMSGWQA